jgi:hypothetical protein
MRPAFSPVFPGVATKSRMFPNEMLRLNVTTEAFRETAGSVSY